MKKIIQKLKIPLDVVSFGFILAGGFCSDWFEWKIACSFSFIGLVLIIIEVRTNRRPSPYANRK